MLPRAIQKCQKLARLYKRPIAAQGCQKLLRAARNYPKLTRDAKKYLELPRTSQSHPKLPRAGQTARSYPELPTAVQSGRKVSRATKNCPPTIHIKNPSCPELPKATRSCQELPRAAKNYPELPRAAWEATQELPKTVWAKIQNWHHDEPARNSYSEGRLASSKHIEAPSDDWATDTKAVLSNTTRGEMAKSVFRKSKTSALHKKIIKRTSSSSGILTHHCKANKIYTHLLMTDLLTAQARIHIPYNKTTVDTRLYSKRHRPIAQRYLTLFS